MVLPWKILRFVKGDAERTTRFHGLVVRTVAVANHEPFLITGIGVYSMKCDDEGALFGIVEGGTAGSADHAYTSSVLVTCSLTQPSRTTSDVPHLGTVVS